MATPTIFRTTNPLDEKAVDGVYIDERRPPSAIHAVPNDVVAMVGHFQKGPVNIITSISSARELQDTFGGLGPDANGNFYPGALSLQNKQFGRLRVVRVAATGGATAGANLVATSTTVLRADASSPGAWGNTLSLVIAAASDAVSGHFNMDVKLSGVIVERYKNIDPTVTQIGQLLPLGSAYINVSRVAVGRPDNNAAVALTLGADGTPVAGDYSNAIDRLRASDATGIRWIYAACEGMDSGLIASVNGLLRDCAVDTSTKIAILNGPFTQTKAQAISDVVLYRSDRCIYVYPAVYTFVSALNGGAGGLMLVGLNSFAASVCSALPPGTDPATVDSEKFLTGIRQMYDLSLERGDYINFNEQGIMALIFGEREAFRFRSGVTTSNDQALKTVLRRTITDFIQESIALALTDYQNKPLNKINKLMIKSAIAGFLDRMIKEGLLPSRDDLHFEDGQREPYEIDIVSGNTAESEALGQFVVILRLRIFPAMRFLVLRTEIGEDVDIRTSEIQQAA